MKLSEIKQALHQTERVSFLLPDGSAVPAHFHVTEVGKVSKHFIDCGGTVRTEERANFQLWNANDYDHRLHPEKLLQIIHLSEEILGIEDLEIEVEYQGSTIGKYGLSFDGTHFYLTSQFTDCLAKEKCGIPEAQLPKKPKVKLADLQKSQEGCAPSSGCC